MLEEPAEITPLDPVGESSIPPAPSPMSDPPVRRSGRARRFPPGWRDYEATSYTPVVLPPVDEEVFEQQIEPPPAQPPALAIPDMSRPSPQRSQLNRFRICRVSTSVRVSATTNEDLSQPSTQTSPPHPFRNDSTFEMVKAFCVGPSSNTTTGMDHLVSLFTSGRVTHEELAGFRAVTELRHLDRFAEESPIGGGPWHTGSVKVKMPCMRANEPSFSREKDAPEFEISGIRYRSLVDIITARIQDTTTSGPFVQTPFTEWWYPSGTTHPIRIYGEAYSSDIAIQLAEEIKRIPPPADHPDIESVVVMLMLGSDATHLANFGTASLWPIYVFFGNMSKYDSSRPSEFPASHLAYLPKVGYPTTIRGVTNLIQIPTAA